MANKILCVANLLAFPLAKPTCDHDPMSSYEPDTKDAALFAKHKAARKVIKDTRAPVMSAAERAIRGGATNQELAEWTGLTAENFRKLAETLGIDNRVKAPTVGREAEARRASAVQLPEPNERPSPPTPEPRDWPPAELGFDPRIQALTPDQAKRIADQVQLHDFGWLRGVRKRLSSLSPDLVPYAIANAALLADKVQLPGA